VRERVREKAAGKGAGKGAGKRGVTDCKSGLVQFCSRYASLATGVD